MAALDDRIRFWPIALVVLVATLALLGSNGVIVLFAVCSLQALREFLTLTHTRRADHWALLVAFFVVLPLQYALIAIDWYGLWSVMIPVYAFLGLPIISALRRDTVRYMERIAEVQWGLMTCVYCLSYLPALLTMPIQGFERHGVMLILFIVVVVQGAELLQEAAGRYASLLAMPNSIAVEFGMVAIAGATIAVALCGFTPFDADEAAGLGAVIAALGLAGSIVMEAVRRDRGVEDWRRHDRSAQHSRGTLDRFERLVFAAPVFFHLVRFWWTV